MWVPSSCCEDTPEAGMATQSNIISWGIPWQKPGGLQSIGSQRQTEKRDWARTWLFFKTNFSWFVSSCSILGTMPTMIQKDRLKIDSIYKAFHSRTCKVNVTVTFQICIISFSSNILLYLNCLKITMFSFIFIYCNSHIAIFQLCSIFLFCYIKDFKKTSFM